MPTRPTCRRSFSRRSSACMRIRGWGGRRFTRSFSRRPTVSGLPTSTRRGMSRSTPSITRDISCGARSTRGRRGTRRRCFSRFARSPIPTAASDGVWRLPRRRCGEPEECPGDQGAGGSAAVPRADRPGAARPGGVGAVVAGPGGLLRNMSACSARASSPGGRSTWCWTGWTRSSCCWTAGNLTIHPRCVRLKEAFRNYCRQRRGGQWIDFPADGHPEEDLIDALRGGIRDAMPEGSASGSNKLARGHAAGII